MGKMTLTGKGRRWLMRGHPWVYKDDIGNGKGDPGERASSSPGSAKNPLEASWPSISRVR